MNKNYKKNPYYTNEDIAKAVKLADNFYNKKYRPQLLRSGNKKLGSNVAIFDLPTIVTCKYKCKDCYAIKAERLYKNTRVMRAFHYEIVELALKDSEKYDYLVNYINTELSKHKLLYKNPVVRIHSSGDFYRSDYFNMWFYIATKNPDIKFYSYTKVYANKEIDKLNSCLDNFNIVKSLVDDKYINYGSLEYLEDLEKILQASKQEYTICGYGHSENKLNCMGNCTACLNCSNILFVKH